MHASLLLYIIPTSRIIWLYFHSYVVLLTVQCKFLLPAFIELKVAGWAKTFTCWAKKSFSVGKPLKQSGPILKWPNRKFIETQSWLKKGLLNNIGPFYLVWYSLPVNRPGYNDKWPPLAEVGPCSIKNSLFQSTAHFSVSWSLFLSV